MCCYGYQTDSGGLMEMLNRNEPNYIIIMIELIRDRNKGGRLWHLY